MTTATTSATRARPDRWWFAALAALLAATAAFYAAHPGLLGWGNQYYAAVAQSGAGSWKALLFATPDLGAVTATDKPPLAFWPMALAVRAFGLHGWSLALPQLLESLATVAVLAVTVRRAAVGTAGQVAGLVAGAVLATTPIFLTLARFDDPDTLLTLLITIGAYAAVRSAESARARWLVLLGTALGCAFLTKWLVALVPAPALMLVAVSPWLNLVRGRRRPVLRRSGSWRVVLPLLASGLVAGLWWVLLVVLTPAASRPFPDSRNGSILELVFQQNGVGRFSYATPSASALAIKGVPGPFRLVTNPFAGQVGWLIPLAVLSVLGGVVVWRRTRVAPGAVPLVFTGWFVLTGAVFSLMAGAMHPYYTVLLAPATAAVVGLAAGAVCAHRPGILRSRVGRVGLAVLPLVGASYAAWILAAYPHLHAWSAAAVAGGVVAGASLLALASRRIAFRRSSQGLGVVAIVASAVALLAGPIGFSAATTQHSVSGANPIAGPTEAERGAPPFPQSLVSFLSTHRGRSAWLGAVITSTPASQLQLQTGQPVLPLGGFTGQSGGPTVGQVRHWAATGQLRYLILTGPFSHALSALPSGQDRTATMAVVRWALTAGCPVDIPGTSIAVLDIHPAGPCAVEAAAPTG